MPGKFFLYPFEVGQEVILRKEHPCGGKRWRLERVGAEVLLKCTTCSRRLTMTRAQLEKSCSKIESDSQIPDK